MKTKILFTTFMLLMAYLAYGQEEEEHPIDQALEECMNTPEGSTTIGMIGCMQEAEEAWDKELNRAYKQLRSIMSAEEKTSLLTAQRAWLAYRDAEFSFNGDYHGNMQGTMWGIVGKNRRMNIVKARALELNDYYLTRTEP